MIETISKEKGGVRGGKPSKEEVDEVVSRTEEGMGANHISFAELAQSVS